MSLPELIKHVYHNATDEVIRRGKKIFHTSGVQILENDTLIEQVVFRVRNDIYSNYYKVTVQYYLQPKNLSLRCQCPYNMGTVCRHEAAALFQLNDLLQSGYFENTQLSYNQKHTTVRMRQITTHFLKLFSSAKIFEETERWVEEGRAEVYEAKDDTVKARVRDDDGVVQDVILKQNEERYFDTSCGCGHKEHPLCVHKTTVFLSILQKHGGHYFGTLRNWDTQKEKLLNLYGYSLEDDLSGKFEFSYHEGKPFLRVLDTSIKKLSLQPSTQLPSKAAPRETLVDTKSDTATTIGPQRRMGLLLVPDGSKYYPFTGFDLISGTPDEAGEGYQGTIEKLESGQYISPQGMMDRDKMLVTSLRKQSADELFKFIKRDAPFGEFWDSLPQEMTEVPKEELKKQAWEFYLPRYQRLFEGFATYPFIYFLPKGKRFLSAHLIKSHFSTAFFQTSIFVYKEKGEPERTVMELRIEIGSESYPYADVKRINPAILQIDNVFYAAANLDVIEILEKFGDQGKLEIPWDEWPAYLEGHLLPKSASTSILFDESLKEYSREQEPKLKLYLKETERTMVFKPIFDYNGVEKQWLDYTPAITAVNGKVIVLERDEASEQTFLTLLRHLHPSMQESRKAHSFLLPAEEALKGNWYFSFLDRLQEAQVEIVGVESLKQLRINPNKPRTQLQISSGIDWFDAEVDLSFGEEKVSLADVKKALGKRQNFVHLSDGSMGLLSEDWMERYSLMVKLGSVNGKNIRLKKIHFSAIEGLSDEIGDQQTIAELMYKRKRLLDYDYGQDHGFEIPENVRADLRPYQKAGFQWMAFLNEISWGGILADDMGLGKTLQTLTFVQYYLNRNPDALFLVACPTTLIYNWENEIKKFTPDITYAIHHGPQRRSKAEEFESRLIITTYGTLRSDIKMLSQMKFDYVILDESQAIKNPMSQVAKASLMLESKNRIALSGTPVQNNTFDLYAQMNFLNPGMLGSMEFFRNEFATPIDKMQEEDAKKHLRKLIHPFLLRRTKEQVAPDLPKKTEMVLFCEMGAKQRKIYDAFRNSFRTKILGEIEERGMERSQLSILTGLMKLRQICDSPAILNDDEKFDNHSIKIEELIRELTENTGSHKALVFSQFLGMLGLIREELEKQNIPYVYFDGSTSSSDREKAIQSFQNDETCRVFLISLKAGGVGLNLTAADYVYIVDPWWNPAVEQQAIDRTHRIGQTKSIFAYRLICKDTIEEKILLLQERKLTLVKDLVADDNAFVKRLTKEDVAYLLS